MMEDSFQLMGTILGYISVGQCRMGPTMHFPADNGLKGFTSNDKHMGRYFQVGGTFVSPSRSL